MFFSSIKIYSYIYVFIKSIPWQRAIIFFLLNILPVGVKGVAFLLEGKAYLKSDLTSFYANLNTITCDF